MKKKLITVLISIVVLLLFVLYPVSILMLPIISPAEYLSSILYVEIGNLILIKPSSTFFVYLLGVITIIFGVLIYRKKTEESKTWWGLALIFWGIGTLLAGSSYQGFGYELKCDGLEYCLFTSWFELSYLYVTALSITLMSFGVSIKTLKNSSLKLYNRITSIGFLTYTLSLVLGVLLELKFLISYEWFLVFFLPYFLSFFILNIKGYKKDKNSLDKGLIIVWLIMLVVNLAYFVYLFSGLGELLYENYNIWFSANDVLHIGLIGWMYYIYKIVSNN
ncbi:hypothetical protein RJI07_03530 [Mycoplasmatota bacterium WC30]